MVRLLALSEGNPIVSATAEFTSRERTKGLFVAWRMFIVTGGQPFLTGFARR
jgi:hypothetical protein